MKKSNSYNGACFLFYFCVFLNFVGSVSKCYCVNSSLPIGHKVLNVYKRLIKLDKVTMAISIIISAYT